LRVDLADARVHAATGVIGSDGQQVEARELALDGKLAPHLGVAAGDGLHLGGGHHDAADVVDLAHAHVAALELGSESTI
jgi:hypothetical protein